MTSGFPTIQELSRVCWLELRCQHVAAALLLVKKPLNQSFQSRFALRKAHGTSGREERLWQIQCKREKSITPKRIAAYLEEMIPSGATVPHGVILAAP